MTPSGNNPHRKDISRILFFKGRILSIPLKHSMMGRLQKTDGFQILISNRLLKKDEKRRFFGQFILLFLPLPIHYHVNFRFPARQSKETTKARWLFWSQIVLKPQKWTSSKRRDNDAQKFQCSIFVSLLTKGRLLRSPLKFLSIRRWRLQSSFTPIHDPRARGDPAYRPPILEK